MQRHEGTVALVTGAASGIGEACVVRLRDEGATVVTLDVNGDVDHTVDITDEDAVAAVVDSIVAEPRTARLGGQRGRRGRRRSGPPARHEPSGTGSSAST